MEEKEKQMTSDKRMAIFDYILKMKGMKWADVVRTGVVSQQRISYYRVNDDIYLETIQKIMETIGISVVPEFTKTGKETENSAITKENGRITTETPEPQYRFVVKGDFFKNETQKKPGEKDNMKKLINERASTECRTGFIARLIKSSGMGSTEFWQKTGLTQFSLYKLLLTDNVRISTIYQIAEKMGTQVEWTINAIPK